MRYKIAIIGAGQMGSRHLQALGLIDRNIEISVFDPNSESLRFAKQRFEEIPENKFVHSVSYHETLDSLHSDVDVAIIATSADIRKRIVEDLLERTKVRYLILEKIAFQSVCDFEAVISLLKDKQTKAWVNCSYRRMFPFYQNIRKHFRAGEQVYFNVWGGGWKLACNSIHFLDLFSYLTGDTNIHLNDSHLDDSICDSKRDGFKELTGTLRGKTNNGSEITLWDYKGSVVPYVIQIFKKDAHFTIFESQGKAIIARKANDWTLEEVPITFLHQSQLTHLIVQHILDTENCELASIEEALLLHKPMLDAILDHLNNVTGKIHDLCPIT